MKKLMLTLVLLSGIAAQAQIQVYKYEDYVVAPWQGRVIANPCPQSCWDAKRAIQPPITQIISVQKPYTIPTPDPRTPLPGQNQHQVDRMLQLTP